MATRTERISTTKMRFPQFPTVVLREARERGWAFLKSPLTHSLLLAAAIGFGIKLNHDHDQTLAELNRPAYTTSQIQERERSFRSATQHKEGWERVGALLAGLTLLRMAQASRNPTIDRYNQPPDHELPFFWREALARQKPHQ